MKVLPRRLRRSLATPGADGVEEPILEPRPRIIQAEALRWIQIDEPRLADRLWLAENFGFHELDLEDVASRNQRPKVDEYPDYLFLVMQFPRFDKVTGRLHAAELDVFIGRDYVITLPNETIVPLPQLFERPDRRILPPALDPRDVFAAELRFLSELTLRPTASLPESLKVHRYASNRRHCV